MSTTSSEQAFRKRHRTVFTKAHELKLLAPDDIKVFILVEHKDHNMLYHWNSNLGDVAWPPDLNGLVPGKLKSMSPEDMRRDDERRRRIRKQDKPSSSSSAAQLNENAVNGVDEVLSPSFLLVEAAFEEEAGSTKDVSADEDWASTLDFDFAAMTNDRTTDETWELSTDPIPDDVAASEQARDTSTARAEMADLHIRHESPARGVTNRGKKRQAVSPIAFGDGELESPRGRVMTIGTLPTLRSPLQQEKKKRGFNAHGARRISRLAFPSSPN